MADGDGIARVPGLTDEAEPIDVSVFRESIEVDGDTVEVEVQRVVPAFVRDGVSVDTSTTDPHPMADYSAPYVGLDCGGADVGPASTEVVPASAARMAVDVVNAGGVAVWLGIGQTAAVGDGIYLAAGGGSMSIQSGEAVNAIAVSTGPTRVGFQGWAT